MGSRVARRSGNWMPSLVGLAVNAAVAIAAVALGFSGLAITAGTVARYVFRSPITGVEEISSYSLVAIVFLGLAHTRRAGGHIRVDLASRFLRPAAWRLLEVCGLALGIAYVLLLAWGALTIAVSSYQIQAFSMVLRVPLFVPWFLVPLGLAILAADLIDYSLHRVRSK